MTSGAEQAIAEDHQLAGYGPASVKPNSITRWALDGKSILKLYRTITPHERQRREVDALQLAAERGIAVPPVVSTGEHRGHPWTMIGSVPGNRCSIRTVRGVQEFVRRVHEATQQIHIGIAGVAPGSGWRWQPDEPAMSNRDFLLDQLSSRCEQLDWWSDMEDTLESYGSARTVYLYGDFKPEHLLVDGEQLYIVDWEASGRGPAASDQADATFHVVRDLIYGAAQPRRLPIGIISRLGAPGPALAWRIALWLDRRRPGDVRLVRARDLYQLAALGDPAAACEQLARMIAVLRTEGVPR
ncbi:aminoglycoside phosphotransferase family protein [Streptomyces sp. WMMC905]|uniref:aminoglycoside phosphotransferase family protein n=1 Tax=Streptomyces sp. WMMC905 TaxID=3404123 RepID=UPI003B955656